MLSKVCFSASFKVAENALNGKMIVEKRKNSALAFGAYLHAYKEYKSILDVLLKSAKNEKYRNIKDNIHKLVVQYMNRAEQLQKIIKELLYY